MRRIVTYLVVFIISLSCAAQKIKMMKTNDRFDYEYYKKKIGKEKIDNQVYKESDSTLGQILISHDENSVYMIKPMSFVMYIRNYYKHNNRLKREGCFFLYSSVRVGTWREYDDKGNLIKVTDEDAKFKHLAMRPKDVLMWMQRQGWINLSTGEGQQTTFSNTPFDIYFIPRNKHKNKENTHAKWFIKKSETYGTEDVVLDAETRELIHHGKTFSIE